MSAVSSGYPQRNMRNSLQWCRLYPLIPAWWKLHILKTQSFFNIFRSMKTFLREFFRVTLGLQHNFGESTSTSSIGYTETNNVKVFPSVLDVFFGLHRPNYARWGTLSLQKLQGADPRLRAILEKGAFSVRRTKKNYSRSAVDLSLKQSVNRDSASATRGIISFWKSEGAMRHWSLTMTQRAMAATELRTFTGLELGEHAAS